MLLEYRLRTLVRNQDANTAFRFLPDPVVAGVVEDRPCARLVTQMGCYRVRRHTHTLANRVLDSDAKIIT